MRYRMAARPSVDLQRKSALHPGELEDYSDATVLPFYLQEVGLHVRLQHTLRASLTGRVR